MAFAGPCLDPGSGHTAGTVRYHPFTAAFGAVLGHSHCFHTGWSGMYHVVGSDRRQPVRRRRSFGRGRTVARHRISPVDRARRQHATVLRHRSLRHGGYWHREYHD